jgi:two-component system chemotaxis response regulator CheY
MTTVLIIDDSAGVRQHVEDALTPRGMNVVTAANAMVGLTRLRDGADIDLVICDMNMPGMTGMQFLLAAKAIGLTVPVVLMTSDTQPAGITKAKAAGARGWIVKPIAGPALFATVEGLLKLGPSNA